MEVKSKGHPLISGKSGLVKYLFWPDICHIYVSHGFVSSINFGCSRPDMGSIPPAPNVVQLSKQRCGHRLPGRATWALSRGKIVARVEGHGFDISVHNGWDMMGPLCLQSKSGWMWSYIDSMLWHNPILYSYSKGVLPKKALILLGPSKIWSFWGLRFQPFKHSQWSFPEKPWQCFRQLVIHGWNLPRNMLVCIPKTKKGLSFPYAHCSLLQVVSASGFFTGT